MSVMQELDAARVPDEQIRALESFAASLEASELRDLLQALSASVKSGSDVTLLESDTELTPSQAAARLKMSRTHLYKLLDRGEIVSHTVGRDRRIRVTDLARFEASRQRDRRELAERFAHADKTRRGAAEELFGDL
jgi:excisionase family DNA binding protein